MTCILIEDDIAWRTKLQIMLDELGITILSVATTVAETATLLKKHKPQFILADILLGNELVFDAFKNNTIACKIPVILITISDKDIHYKQANNLLPHHIYVVKPVHKLTLKSAIENLAGAINPASTPKTTSLKIKGKYNERIEIPFDKIVYLQQNLKYCTIHTPNKQFTIKKPMQEVVAMLNSNFLRVHTSFCVNTHFIQSVGVGLQNIKLAQNNVAVPIGIRYTDGVKKYIAAKNIAIL